MLVGFMGAGKSTVGRLLASELGWELIDFDAEIERREGRSVAEIFAGAGEEAFREAEAALTARLAHGTGVVLAPGGGWALQPGMLEALAGPSTLTVWLDVSAAEAARRVAAMPGSRPLLGSDPAARAERLLAERRDAYARAEVRIDTDDRSAEAVASEIARIVRERTRSGPARRG